jgi:uncharacterized protein YecE (DUF72 family)
MEAVTTNHVHVGCSGWSYPHWRGPVYPCDAPARTWFGIYQSMFDTVELNATFYRLPRPETVEKWRAAAPPGFVYSLKLGAFGSHRMKLRDAATWLPNHVDRARLLGPTLGPTLIQMPPRWRRDAARLDEMLSVAPRDLRWAVEFREPSWLHDDVFEVLRSHAAALCIHDLLEDHPFLLTTDWTYIRRHGPHGPARPYQGRYGPHRLAALARRLDDLQADGNDVYCYFNNDEGGHAVADAAWLADRLGVRRPSPLTAPAGSAAGRADGGTGRRAP